MAKNSVYMLVTNDEYELPIIIADSAAELASKLSITENCIYSAISHATKRGQHSRYVKVEFEEEQEEKG